LAQKGYMDPSIDGGPPAGDMDEKGVRNKVFIGGLSWDTSDSAFATYFSKFGEIKDAVIMRDKLTGGSRGFGFVTFASSSSVDKLIAAKDAVELDGRHVDVKVAVPKEQLAGGTPRTKKIFVGGLAPEITEQEFKEHFSQFGAIADATIMVDTGTNRSRGFGFVTYESEDSLYLALSKEHTLGGKRVECKKAIPKEQMSQGPLGRGRGGALDSYYRYPFPPMYGGRPPYDPYAYRDPYPVMPPAYSGYGADFGYGARSSAYDRTVVGGRQSKNDRSYHPYR